MLASTLNIDIFHERPLRWTTVRISSPSIRWWRSCSPTNILVRSKTFYYFLNGQLSLCAGDTLLVCANGHLTDNKLAVGLLFPCLLTSDIFALPIENVLLVPDYTMEVG